MLKKNVVLNARKLKKINMVKVDCKTLVFFTIAICGVIIGVFTTKNISNDWNSVFSQVLNFFCLSKTDSSLLSIFFKLFLPVFIIYTLIYIIGTCAMGVPFLCICIFSIGWFLGLIISHYCVEYGFMGICYCGLVYLPVYAIATASVIKCCCNCFNISSEIFYYLIMGKGESKNLFKDYTIRHTFFVVPIAIGAMIGTISFKMFSDLFNFI